MLFYFVDYLYQFVVVYVIVGCYLQVLVVLVWVDVVEYELFGNLYCQLWIVGLGDQVEYQVDGGGVVG